MFPSRRPGILTVVALLLALITTGVGPAEAQETRSCRGVHVPVSLGAGAPKDEQQVYGELCTPGGRTPRAVMLLTHGVTYDHHYFDFPGFGGRYSYAAAANRAGYATFTMDRLGSGRSSHPPGVLLDMDANVWVAHQVVQHLCATFQRVISVGHSYGSGVTWLEASRHKDVDAVIITGANHFLNYDAVRQVILPSLIPAPLDPTVSRTVADPSYLTTRAGTRYTAFMAPGSVDPDVVAADEELKQTVTVAEAVGIPIAIGAGLAIRVPVLIAQGDRDALFCGAGVDCTSEEQLLIMEAPRLGNPRCVAAYLQPGAGHDNVLMSNAPDFFRALNAWSAQAVPPNGAAARGCPRFDPDDYKGTGVSGL